MDIFNLIFSGNNISINTPPPSSNYLQIKITLDYKHKTISLLEISYYAHELIFSHTISDVNFFLSLAAITGSYDIFTNIYSYTIDLSDNDIQAIKSTCDQVYGRDYDLPIYFIFGLATYIAFIILIENNIVPVPICLPYSLYSGKNINRNMFRLFSLPLMVLRKLTTGIMCQLVQLVQMFSNFWDVVFIDGPTIPLDIQSKIYFDMIDIYTTFLYNETQRKFDDLFLHYEQKLSDLSVSNEKSMTKPYIRDLSINTNKYYNPKNHRTRTGKIPLKPQKNSVENHYKQPISSHVQPIKISENHYKQPVKTSENHYIQPISEDKTSENHYIQPVKTSENYYKQLVPEVKTSENDYVQLSESCLFEVKTSEKYYKQPVEPAKPHIEIVEKYYEGSPTSAEILSDISLNVKKSIKNNNSGKDNEIIYDKIIQNTSKYIIDGRNSDQRGAFNFNWVSESVEKDTDSDITGLESGTHNTQSIDIEKSGDSEIYSSGPQIYFS